ncbi:ABC transporter ATP-binding protein [Nocardia sp. CA-290969]|uniref:ABC transporter ATP-binding protein n=1 Tax=Nocardia sp. CA-290969 TaxID=3239986 RepID=UPI003D90A9DD
MNSHDPEPILDVRKLSHTFGKGAGALHVIDDVSFALHAGDAMAIVGPSGAGKTTLLRCLTGLLTPTSGDIHFDGQRISGVPKGISVVFQDYSRSLYPWLTALANVVFPLKNSKLSRRDCSTLAMDALDLVGLQDMAKKYPWQMSGGMQQRVAIARALITEPRLLFMDEPFASVDAQTRAELEDLTLRIRESRDMSVVSVTHDIDESVFLSDHVLVMSRRPSTVLEELSIDLPYPRDQMTTKSRPEFLTSRSRVHQLILAEKTKEGASR